jgi:hypothetical protein
MANFIVDFLFGPANGDKITKYEGGEKGALKDLFGEAAKKSYAEMSDEEYDAALKDKLKEVKYNMPVTDEGYGKTMSRSGINARNMAMLALDRGLPMYQPAGPDRTFTDEQYLQTLAQQPPTNKYFSPEEDAAAKQAFAQKLVAFKNPQPFGLNTLRNAIFGAPQPQANAMTRSPYDALVFGPANNPAPFSAGPSQGEVNTLLPSNRFQARRIGR